MIQNLIFIEFFFWKYYYGQATLLYSSTRSNGHHQSFFLIFRFSSRKSQSQQKLARKITHFTIQFYSKNLTHFTNLNSLDIENNMLPQHDQKPFWLYKFSSKHISVWCQKKHLGCTISWRQRTAFFKHFEKANVCIFLYISVRKCLFQRRSKILSEGERVGLGIGEMLNNFLKAARWLGLIKCFTIFNFNWNFLKFKHFSAWCKSGTRTLGPGTSGLWDLGPGTPLKV